MHVRAQLNLQNNRVKQVFDFDLELEFQMRNIVSYVISIKNHMAMMDERVNVAIATKHIGNAFPMFSCLFKAFLISLRCFMEK